MRALGIDFGEKRVGLAISDETFTLARELDILNPKEFFKKITGIIADNELSVLVLGLPLSMSGTDTPQTEYIRDIKERLESVVTVPVVFIDERLSSYMAERESGQKTQIDSIAAKIILQTYLDKQKNKHE